MDIYRSLTVFLDRSIAAIHLSISYLFLVLKWYFLTPVSIYHKAKIIEYHYNKSMTPVMTL